MRDRDEPFLVYTANRPYRIAFLIDIKQSTALAYIEKIINYAYRKWGGRFFQIIPLKNGKISDVWLKYLSEYDPDIICSLVGVDQNSLKKITLQVHPYVFEKINMSRGGIHFTDDPVDVLPSEQNTANIWRNPFDSPPKIFGMDLIGLKSRAPKYIQNFVNFNFGQLDDTFFSVRLLEKYDVTKAKVYDKRSLLIAMKTLDQWTRYIYPNDYSRLPGIHYESERHHEKERAILFIGDDPMDVILYWNRALSSPEWLSRKMIHAWIPIKFVDDADIRISIMKWMDKFVDFGNGNSGYKELTIASFSLTQSKLDSYKTLLAGNTYIAIKTEKIQNPPELNYSAHIGINQEMQSFNVSGQTFNINLPIIDQQQGGMLGQKWMSDVLIQQKDDDRNVMPAKELWLQFPQNNNLAYSTFPQRPARINRQGISSIPISRKNEDLLVKITIPSEESIVSTILLGEPDTAYYTVDVRKGVLVSAFGNYRSSQSGRQLRGFIHLFDGLMDAVHFFDNPYWRRTIMALAGENTIGDSPRNNALRARIHKNLSKLRLPVDNKAVDVWMKTIHGYAHDLKLNAVYKDFEYFKNELIDEFETYKNNGEVGSYSPRAESRMRAGLSWLIGKNVLLSGFMYACTHCGLKSWHSVDDVKTLNECPGCGYQFMLEAEEKWFYKLNTLAGNGAIFSQIPIIAALGELHSRARYSFFYSPPVDVQLQGSNRILTDLDLFAIIDGKLVIGEVKNTQSLLKDADFEKLYKVASRLRPSFIYISCPEKIPTAMTKQRINDLQIRVKKFGVVVEWLELSHSFGFFDINPEYVF